MYKKSGFINFQVDLFTKYIINNYYNFTVCFSGGHLRYNKNII